MKVRHTEITKGFNDGLGLVSIAFMLEFKSKLSFESFCASSDAEDQAGTETTVQVNACSILIQLPCGLDARLQIPSEY